jgi:eukaryotic-like serine/threonine-protein kinase
MPNTRVREVTIFVSSPNDVAPERSRVQAVTAKLNREYEGLVRFETVLWEEHFYTADKSFQPQIPEAVASDIVVSIFWTRIGTELQTGLPCMSNGKPYPSGTAYELLTALEASKAKGVPDVYVFRKTADATLPMADAERRRQAQTQLDALEAFWSEWFRSEKGEFKAAFQNFPSTDAFEQEIELLLRQWLETHGCLGPRIAWPKEKGSPFRGLAPFEAEHAAVFFGRARVIDEARRRLAGAAEGGSPFLLIVRVGQIFAGARRTDPAADHARASGFGGPVARGANEARRGSGGPAHGPGDGPADDGCITRIGARRLSECGQPRR